MPSGSTQTSVYLNQIETAVPPYEVHEKFVSFALGTIKDERLKRVFSRVASKCQIETRYSVVEPHSDPEKLSRDGLYVRGAFASTEERMRVYKDSALRLAKEPIARLLENTRADEITHLIVTSCTGFYAPGLDLEIQSHFKLRSDLERTIVGFMGCYAAFNALKLASHIVRSQPAAKVLLVNIELCSLHMQENTDLDKLLGFLQFADGCAVSLVSAEKRGLELNRFRCETIEDRKSLITWNIGNHGFEMFLSMEVPQALGQNFDSVVPRIASPAELANLKSWAVHPGGRAILDIVEQKLALGADSLLYSRDVLRKFGNMSSATILFVMREILNDSSLTGPGIAMAFGPGLTVETLNYERIGQGHGTEEEVEQLKFAEALP